MFGLLCGLLLTDRAKGIEVLQSIEESLEFVNRSQRTVTKLKKTSSQLW